MPSVRWGRPVATEQSEHEVRSHLLHFYHASCSICHTLVMTQHEDMAWFPLIRMVFCNGVLRCFQEGAAVGSTT
eukprot:COSAG05_NODE_1212_length_5494_cov_603.311399_7_plen_74_part_00